MKLDKDGKHLALESYLGSGAFGTVFKVESTNENQPYVMKVMDYPGQFFGVKSEYEVLKKLNGKHGFSYAIGDSDEQLPNAEYNGKKYAIIQMNLLPGDELRTYVPWSILLPRVFSDCLFSQLKMVQNLRFPKGIPTDWCSNVSSLSE